jgi:hypothetical protein
VTSVRLSASGTVTQAGRFEVLAITAGEGNGWQFSEDVLRESLSLWDGVECFVDHGGWFGGGRSGTWAGSFLRRPGLRRIAGSGWSCTPWAPPESW